MVLDERQIFRESWYIQGVIGSKTIWPGGFVSSSFLGFSTLVKNKIERASRILQELIHELRR